MKLPNLPSIRSRPQSLPGAQNWFAFVLLFLCALATPSLLAAVDDHNPIGVSGVFEGVTTTAGAYNVLNHNATRQIDDIVVPGAIGKYGLKMTRYYNSRNQHYFNQMGPGWTHEYMWVNGGDRVDYPNGSVWDSHCTGDWGLGGPLGVSDWLGTYVGYPTFRLADGGAVFFTGVDINGTTYYSLPTYIVDPYDQLTTLTYNASGLLDRVTEPGGRYLQFFYTLRPAPYSHWNLTRVEAHPWNNGPVTDWVNYTYALKNTGGSIVTQGWCLITVSYSDGQQASYAYTEDNQPDNPSGPCPCPIKILPLVRTCKDVRYKGPMRSICYDYKDGGPHGEITAERYSVNGSTNGVQVSKITPPAPSPLNLNPAFDTAYTETRGDGPTRTFNYTSLHLGRDPDGGCPTWNPVSYPAPQQFLQNYTDFNQHTTYLYYDSKWYVNSVKDANGHFTDYLRGPPPNAYPGAKGIGQILKITHREDGTHIDYTYAPEPSATPAGVEAIQGHYVQQIKDERGNITYHTRDANFRITRTDHKNAAGTVLAYEEFTYGPSNNLGLLSTHHLLNGSYEHFKYDSRGLLIGKTNPTTISDWATAFSQAPQTTYSYYTSGAWTDRIQTMTLPANVNGFRASETYEYDVSVNNTSRGLVTKITHADGKYQSFGYDAYGNKLWEKNELFKQTSYTYDDYNRVLTVKDPIGQTTGHTTTYRYNATNGNNTDAHLHTTNSPDMVTTPAGIATTNDYDQNFRKISSSVTGLTTWFGYDNVGNQTYVTDPRGTSPGDAAYTTFSDYDARNRKWRIREPLSHTTWWEFGDNINITDIHRADGTIETKSYDAMNRLSSDTVPQTAQVSLTTSFQYWPSGKLFSETDPKAQATYFFYNEADQLREMVYPDLTSVQTWDYDDAHNLASRTTVNGNTNPGSNEVQHFTYDNRNRKLSMYWDNGADSASFTYYDDGRLHTAQNPNSTVTRNYDDAGRLTLDQQAPVGITAKSVNYPSYDDDGRLLRMYVTGAAGYDFTYSYDATGRFEKIFLTGGGQLFQYYYDAASNEKERDSNFNGVNQFYPRDALNRMQYMDVIKGSTLGRETYGYDMMNRIISVTYTTGPADSFQYYQDGELNIATLGNLGHALTYNLDTAGNRSTVVDNTITTTYTPNVFNQYTAITGASITNGPNHEISDYQGAHYTYINDERLISVGNRFASYQLAYDALGRCVKRIIPGGGSSVIIYYIYDGEKPILEYDANGASAGTNLYGKGIDEILERVAIGFDGNWYTYYTHQNHEGSVTLLTNTTGGAIERYRYNVFGAPTIYDGNWNSRSATLYNNRFLFTGREYAAGFGFYEYRARAYHPGLGRFMSEDPKLFDAGDYNHFRYCHNDPIDMTDPMGTEPPVAYSSQEMSEQIAATRELVGLSSTYMRAAQSAQQGVEQAAQQRMGGLTAPSKLDRYAGKYDVAGSIRTLAATSGVQIKNVNPEDVTTGLNTALEQGRFRGSDAGWDSLLNASKSPAAHFRGYIVISDVVKVPFSYFPKYLAHEGLHFADFLAGRHQVVSGMTGEARNAVRLASERRAFNTQHAFALKLGIPDQPMSNQDIQRAYTDQGY